MVFCLTWMWWGSRQQVLNATFHALDPTDQLEQIFRLNARCSNMKNHALVINGTFIEFGFSDHSKILKNAHTTAVYVFCEPKPWLCSDFCYVSSVSRCAIAILTSLVFSKYALIFSECALVFSKCALIVNWISSRQEIEQQTRAQARRFLVCTPFQRRPRSSIKEKEFMQCECEQRDAHVPA